MGFGFGMGFEQGLGIFNLFSVLFTLVFVLVFGIIIVTIIRGIRQWSKNNNSPRLTVPATVIAKRTNISHHRHGGVNDFHHHHTSTSYYVTFQVESGDRMELHVSGADYGVLIEGDCGKLTFQGTRYLGFDRW